MAEKGVRKEGLKHLIEFEVIDYREFVRRPGNSIRYDLVSWTAEQLLDPSYGVLVMETITNIYQVSIILVYMNYFNPSTFSRHHSIMHRTTDLSL